MCICCYIILFLLVHRYLTCTYNVFYLPLLATFPSYFASCLEFCFFICYIFFSVVSHHASYIFSLVRCTNFAVFLQAMSGPYSISSRQIPSLQVFVRSLNLGKKLEICLIFVLYVLD